MRELYPPIEPFNTGFLKVSDLHTIYYEECGNPKGQPAVFVHGGPGSGVQPEHRRYFDPKHYRIVLFDQRGCGKSTPHAELEENDTWALVEDMESLRQHLGIDKWLVFGGSWGSTLGLAYSETHPERTTHLVLRGIFLLRPWEIDWLYQQGADALFPDYWEKYLEPIPKADRGDLLNAYYRKLTDPDKRVQVEAAKAWSQWEASTSKLIIDQKLIDDFGDEHHAIAFARIECHYFVNNGFMEPNQLLRDAANIENIPTVIVHGRYDVVCPLRNAWELKKVLPKAKLVISPTSGHSAFEEENASALIEATDSFRTK
jgi:proline iminopeptidase